jgi:hypothetical protein
MAQHFSGGRALDRAFIGTQCRLFVPYSDAIGDISVIVHAAGHCLFRAGTNAPYSSWLGSQLLRFLL